MTQDESPALRVLRIYHSGVVREWRARDRELARVGARVSLVCARAWNEGGRVVIPDLGPDDVDVRPVRTFGTHPNLFAYEPRALWRALRSDRFDVVDVHEEPVSIAAAEVQLLAAAARVRAPFCLYSAQNIEKRYPVPFRWLERIALSRATAVHTCNDAAGAILRRKGFQGLVRNLGLGVDEERFAPGSGPASPPGPLRVGFVGRIEARKGVHVLVDAIALVPGCSLELVGDGADRAEVEAQIARLQLGDRARVAGSSDQSDLPDRYRTFDVVVVPSLDTPSWVEQFGRVAVEAMACGVPVVASRSGSLPEVIGDSGILVRPDDPRAIADALCRLAGDPAERQRLGSRGRDRARRYAWASIAARQLDLYRELVARAA